MLQDAIAVSTHEEQSRYEADIVAVLAPGQVLDPEPSYICAPQLTILDVCL